MIKNLKLKQKNFFNKVDISSDEYINSVRVFKYKNQWTKNFVAKGFLKNSEIEVKNKEELEIRLILVETEIFFNEKKYNYAMDTINYGLRKI